MVLQLTLGGSAAVPSQIGIHWQGVQAGDRLTTEWDGALGPERWSVGSPSMWIRRDTYGVGERWQLDLSRVPVGVPLICLVIAAPSERSLGMAVVPLSGSADDAVLHPGVHIGADENTVVLELRRVGPGWQAVARNTVRQTDDVPDQHRSNGALQQPGINSASSMSIAVPDHLQVGVDRIRASGAARGHGRVSAVLDLSASMRPWLLSGVLADTVTAIMAVACASSRPFVAIRVVPDGGIKEVGIENAAGDVLGGFLERMGLRTGGPSALRTEIAAAAVKGGPVFVVTDDPFVAGRVGDTAIVVLLGSEDVRSGDHLVAVPGDSVDIGLLARDLATAAADNG